jgi:hypothetical protein
MALADKLNHSTNRLPTSQDEKRPSITDTPSTLATLPTVPGRGQSPNLAIARTTPPFMPTNDISRALIHMTQSLLGFAFMLVVMCVPASGHVCEGLPSHTRAGRSSWVSSFRSSLEKESVNVCLGAMRWLCNCLLFCAL